MKSTLYLPLLAIGLAVASPVRAQFTMPSSPGMHQSAFSLRAGGVMLYGISIPKNYDPEKPAPLILALHAGGQRTRYQGTVFMRSIVDPAMSGMRAIMIAPDCPTNSWTDEAAEQAVMDLVQEVFGRFSIDRRRVLVTGFSLGGRGTWFLSSRHADVFTAAIPMASAPRDLTLDGLATIPTYIIHSRDDEVNPFRDDEKAAKELAAMGRPVKFQALSGLGHFEMYRYVAPLGDAGRWVSDQWNKSGKP